MSLRWWYNEKKKNECSYLHDIGGDGYMDYKKEIIEMIENTENEGKLKFVYTILIKYLKSKKQGD
jgi:hypothetical protein